MNGLYTDGFLAVYTIIESGAQWEEVGHGVEGGLQPLPLSLSLSLSSFPTSIYLHELNNFPLPCPSCMIFLP